MLERSAFVPLCLVLFGCDHATARDATASKADVPAKTADAGDVKAPPPASSPPGSSPPDPASPAPASSKPKPAAAPKLRGQYLIAMLTEPEGHSRNPVQRKHEGGLYNEVAFVGLAFEDDWIQVRLQCVIEGNFRRADEGRRYFSFGSAAANTKVKWNDEGFELPALSLVARHTVMERVGTRDGREWQIDWADETKECTFGLGDGRYVVTVEGEKDGRPSKAKVSGPDGRSWELEAVKDWLSNDDVHKRITDVIGVPK